MPHRRGRGDGTASTNQVESVNRVQTLGRKKHNANKGTVSSGNAFNSKKSCYRCGGNHRRQKCKLTNERCHWCNKIGHTARMCRAKQKRRQPCGPCEWWWRVRLWRDVDVAWCLLSRRWYKGCIRVWKLPWAMQLDTWAAVSIIPEGTYWSVLSKYPLQASTITMKSYIGDAIPIAGKVYIPVTYGKNVHAANRGGMWWATSSARKRLVAEDQTGLEEHFQSDVRSNV